MICDVDGRKLFRGEIAGSTRDAGKLGQELAERLLKNGADEILALKEGVLAHGAG